MGDIFVYPIEDRLYINLTNRCPNRCVFCIRNNEQGVGYDLWLDREPSVEEVLAAPAMLGPTGSCFLWIRRTFTPLGSGCWCRRVLKERFGVPIGLTPMV